MTNGHTEAAQADSPRVFAVPQRSPSRFYGGNRKRWVACSQELRL